MFLAFPFLHERIGFWWTLASCIAITLACFFVFAQVLRRFGVDLL